jgi:Ca-activated chloride channel homolog
MVWTHFLLQRLALVIAAVWAVGVVAMVAAWPMPAASTVVVTHWVNPYLMESDMLPAFAASFNAAGHRTSAGKLIEVRPYSVNSGNVFVELTALARTGQWSGACTQAVAGCPKDLPADPVLVTPAAAHWLAQVNREVGRNVVDVGSAKTLAASYTGIVTLREMARCLGWPEKQIGIADIVALRENPAGWASLPCSRAEWGRVPLTVFTDPRSSSAGRSMLYALYSIGANKSSDQLTVDDVGDPGVVGYVKRFQAAVDHYGPDAASVGDQFLCDPRYGHFFFLPENQLYLVRAGKTFGTVSCAGTGTAPDAVMIYPKEGATLQRLPAALVQASWVNSEQVEAARRWIEFLLEPPQQTVIVQHGLRPATSVRYADTINPRYGLDPVQPANAVDPEGIDPAVAATIAESWGEVKNSGVLTFVLDSSLASAGPKPSDTQTSLIRALGAMNSRNMVGLVAFSGEVTTRVDVGPLEENRFRVSEGILNTRPRAGSALYDAIQEAISMTDAAPAEPNAIRGVAIFVGSEATVGRSLSDVIGMITHDGKAVRACRGFEQNAECIDEAGRPVALPEAVGTDLVIPTQHPVKVFFIAASNRADSQVGCLLAQATRTDFSCSTPGSLTKVLAQYSDYLQRLLLSRLTCTAYAARKSRTMVLKRSAWSHCTQWAQRSKMCSSAPGIC